MESVVERGEPCCTAATAAPAVPLLRQAPAPAMVRDPVMRRCRRVRGSRVPVAGEAVQSTRGMLARSSIVVQRQAREIPGGLIDEASPVTTSTRFPGWSHLPPGGRRPLRFQLAIRLHRDDAATTHHADVEATGDQESARTPPRLLGSCRSGQAPGQRPAATRRATTRAAGKTNIAFAWRCGAGKARNSRPYGRS